MCVSIFIDFRNHKTTLDYLLAAILILWIALQWSIPVIWLAGRILLTKFEQFLRWLTVNRLTSFPPSAALGGVTGWFSPLFSGLEERWNTPESHDYSTLLLHFFWQDIQVQFYLVNHHLVRPPSWKNVTADQTGTRRLIWQGTGDDAKSNQSPSTSLLCCIASG